MNRQQIGARPDEIRNVSIRLLDHQMNVQQKICGTANGTDDGRADGDVGHEMAIHYVHVDVSSSAGLDGFNRFSQARHIG